MKRKSPLHHLFLLVLVFHITLSPAQVSGFRIGIQAGPNVSMLRGNDLIKRFNSHHFGYSTGVSLDYYGKRHIGFRTGFYYENKGTTIRGTLTDTAGQALGSFSSRTTFDYFTMPLLLQFHFGRRIQMFVNGGGYVGYLSRVKQTNNALPTFLESNTSITGDFLPFDWGLSMAVGASLRVLNRCSLSLEVRDNLGLRNISRLPVYNNQSIKTNVLNVYLGLQYHLAMHPKTQGKKID